MAVFGPQVETRPACRVYVYRVVRDFRDAPAALRYEVWSRKADRVAL